MFECKYKYEVEDSIVCAKYIYKSQKRTQDKIIAFLIPVLMACMVGMLVWDIVKGNPFVWDIVLLVALVVLEVMYFIMPMMVVRSQKKAFEKQKIGEMDYILITINEKTCVEKFFKDDKEQTSIMHELRQLTSYLEDKNRLILVFNNVEYVCIRKDCFVGGIEKLKAHIEKTMAKTMSKTKK